MKNQTGNPVRGSDYFYREKLVKNAWNIIEKGNNILLAAPRRVGKTSLMYYLKDNPKVNYLFLYLITESVNNENEFFRRLVNKVIKTDYIQRSQKITTFFIKHSPKIKRIGPDGVEFGVKDDHNYKEMFINILKSSDSKEKKLIIMLDEFPETLENIIKDEGESAGKHFLQSNRELRQNIEFCKNVQFIYLGSIGLENIVSKLNSMNTINDLSTLKIPLLKNEEPKQLIKQLLEDVDYVLSDDIISYIFKKIEWLIPFYIQLAIEKINDIYGDGNVPKITEGIVNQAFDDMLEDRQHFEHWHLRLRASLKGDEYNFAKELLNIISENETISMNEIYNLVVKYKLENIYKDIVSSLKYDGYINNNDDPEIYRYNSPILRIWWRQNVAN